MYETFINKVMDMYKNGLPKTMEDLFEYSELVIKEAFVEFSDLKDPLKKTPGEVQELRNNFEMLKRLGQGHFGFVYKVQNKHDGRIFAIKVIKLKSPTKANKALEEVRNLAKLTDNDNVIKYFDTFKVEGIEENDDGMINGTDSYSYTSYSEDNSNESGILDKSNSNAQKLFAGLKPKDDGEKDETVLFTKLYIKMEYCDYDLEFVLSEILKEKDKSDGETILTRVDALLGFKDTKGSNTFGIFCPLHILVQIAKGLKFIHENKIVHRDLKPSNIFVNTSGLIKIGDFGLSKDLSKSSPDQRLYGVGTHFYLAPEFLRHKELALKLHLLPKADSFSFGIIALKVLGFLVYSESELVRLNDKIRNGDTEQELSNYFHLSSSTCEARNAEDFKTIANTCYGTAKCFRNSPFVAFVYGNSNAEKLLRDQSLKLVTGLKDSLKRLLKKEPSSRISCKTAFSELIKIQKDAIWR